MSHSSLLIRPALEDDLARCLPLDAGYATRYVWQIDLNESEQGHLVRFQKARLPRAFNVPLQESEEQRLKRWQAASYFILGETRGQVAAYLGLTADPVEPILWISDLVVAPDQRRKGHAGDLLATAARWARLHRLHRLYVALQTKNHPAIQFFSKNGFTFCGYHEYYYRAGEIALFFSMKL
jgi:GNAT superfamily N-acetyltransferase